MRKYLDRILPICFVLPYIEIGPIRRLFEYSDGSSNFPASLLVIILVGMIYYIALPTKTMSCLKNTAIIGIILNYYLILRMMFAIPNSEYSVKVLLFQILWFVLPFWYALIIVNYIIQRQLAIGQVVKRGVALYIIYLVYCIFVNIRQYGFVFSIAGVNTDRLISTGGGPVILGYTIVMILALIITVQPYQSKSTEIIVVVLLTGATLFTGTRGGMWPALILLGISVLTNKRKRLNYFVLIAVMFIAMFINPIEYLEMLFPRIANVAESGRITSIGKGLTLFSEMKPLEWLFGTGFGNLFPYQRYCNFHIDGDNTFFIMGMSMLVQPHNTYIYWLLEAGIVGLILYVALLKGVWVDSSNVSTKNVRQSRMTCVMFIALGMIEATVLIQPGSAGLWWIVLFISVLSTNCEDSIKNLQCAE